MADDFIFPRPTFVEYEDTQTVRFHLFLHCLLVIQLCPLECSTLFKRVTPFANC